jgi:hypothetical protein
MKKLIALFVFVLALAPVIAGAIPPSPPIVVQEVDGTPSGAVSKFVFTNGTVTLSAGVATIDITGGAGQPITLIAGGETKSENLGGITVTNDTNSIFTESSADVLGIDVSKAWPVADQAKTGDSATDFFSEGTIAAARLPAVSSSTAGITPTSSGIADGWVLTVQADGSVAWEASSAGVTTIAAATDTNISTPAEANILIYDGSDSWDNKAVSGDVTLAATGAVTIGADKILESMLKAVDSASDEDVLTYESTTGDFEWHSRNEIASGATIVTYADGALVDFSGITQSAGTDEGLVLPTWGNVSPSSDKKFLAADGSSLKLYNGGWVTIGATAAPTDAKYIVQQADATLSAEQALGALDSGILYNTTTTGVLSIATESQLETALGIAFGTTKTATSGNILVGDGTDFESVAMSGDVTIASGGATTIGADKVNDTHIDWGTGTNQVSLDDVTDGSSYQRVAAADVDANGHVIRFYDSDSSSYLTITGLATTTRAMTVPDSAFSVAGIDINQNISGTWEVQDGVSLNFGNDADWGASYDETTGDNLVFSTAAIGAADATTPMFKILVNSGAGTLTADQYVFGIYNATTRLFSVDEDGDIYAAGNITTQSTTDPAVILDEATAGDTDFWFGINADQEGDDDDYFQIGTGTTAGTGTVWSIDTSGNTIAQGYAKSDYIVLAGGTYNTTIQPGTPTASVSYTWPTGAPASSGYALTSTTAGVLSWSAITATADGSAAEVQFRNSSTGALASDTAFQFNSTNNTLSITQAASNPTLQIGDGTYSWNHTPQLGVEGVAEFDANVFFNGGFVLGSDGAIATAGEVAYASGAFTFFGANSENLVVTVGSASNTTTINSTTGGINTLVIDANNNATTALNILNSNGSNVTNVTVDGSITAGAGVNLGTSQALTGTTALTIGDNNQTVAVNSSDWDISTTGAMTGIGAISMDGDLTLYDAVNDGNPIVAIGSGTNERLSIAVAYESGTQLLEYVIIGTTTADGDADDGEIIFQVDDVEKMRLTDAGMSVTGTLAADGLITFTNATDASAVGTAAVVLSGGLGVTKDVWLGNDIKLDSDSATVWFGADQEVRIEHVADTGLLLSDNSGGGTTQLQFGDSGTYVNQPADGYLGLTGDTGVRLTASDEDIQILDNGANNIAITSTTGVDTITFYGAAAANAMNLATTGTILGAIKVQTAGSTEGAGAHAYSPAAALMYGILITIDDSDSVTTVNLPDYQAAAATDHVKVGASVCVMNLQAKATIIAPAADDKIRTSNGTLNAAAATVTGPATIGAYSCFVLTDASSDVGHWTQMGMNGAWPVTP